MFFMKTEHNRADGIWGAYPWSGDTPFIGFYEIEGDLRLYGVARGDYCEFKPKTVLKLSGKFVEIPLREEVS